MRLVPQKHHVNSDYGMHCIVQKYIFASFPTGIPPKQLESLVHISACYTPNARSPVNHEAHTFPSRGGQAIIPTIAYVAITHGYSALEFPFIEQSISICMIWPNS